MHDTLLIGAHTSAAGGVHNALLEGKEIGATTIQLFTANQRQWHAKPLSEEVVALWFEALELTGIKEIMSHASYLINLGCPDAENLDKSLHAFKEEIKRCQTLKLRFLNVHPGAALKDSVSNCITRIGHSLKSMAPLLDQGDLMVLLETTAGQGSTVGRSFEELKEILDEVGHQIPLGICLDTCHIFAAGYDLRDKSSFHHTLDEFDRIIGLKHLKAFHVNDSKGALGSHVDRHAPLGDGKIGMECFHLLMKDSRTRHIPKYLETPEGPALWKKEIALLRSF
ncbi:MAG: deoxyribonuclease IV [Chlamydiota bacterium]